MARIYAGIDIGTFHVKAVIASADPQHEQQFKVLGTGFSSAKGMRHGYIINTRDAAASIKEAIDKAMQAAKVRVRSARIAIGGVGLEEVRSSSDVSLTASGGEVTERDIDRAIQECEKRASGQLINRKIIHAVPLSFKIDGKLVLGRAVGLRGTKLSVEALLITTLEQHYQDLIDAVEFAGIEVEDVMASPLAASLVTLTKPQKIAGVILANIGAETVSIVVFENDTPISLKVFPVGGANITNDLALSLRLSLTEAEQLKRGAVTGSEVSQRKIDDVVTDRLKDIFELIDAHLKAIGKQRLLPAGIVITGGGSGITTASDIARATLRLPSQTGAASLLANRASTADATWAVSYGLCKWGYMNDQRLHGANILHIFGDLWLQIKTLFKSFLP